tara:strand:+ start:2106 stop:2246 length:141 start_codon:yes stop_codon:yes gene_type:complete
MKTESKRYPEEKGEPGDREKRARWLDIIAAPFELLWWIVVFITVAW